MEKVQSITPYKMMCKFLLMFVNGSLMFLIEENHFLLPRLPDDSFLTRRFNNPSLSDAIQNQQLRYASYRPPTGLQGVDDCYAVVPPYGPQSGHWARNARGGWEGGEDVWAAEKVLPHGTIQNLAKWSMYKEDGMLEGYSPTPRAVNREHDDLDWTPVRQRGPGQGWYNKVNPFHNLSESER